MWQISFGTPATPASPAEVDTWLEWFVALTGLFGALAWPMVVLAVLVVFRRPIIELLPRIERAEAGIFSMHLASSINRAELSVNHAVEGLAPPSAEAAPADEVGSAPTMRPPPKAAAQDEPSGSGTTSGDPSEHTPEPIGTEATEKRDLGDASDLRRGAPRSSVVGPAADAASYNASRQQTKLAETDLELPGWILWPRLTSVDPEENKLLLEMLTRPERVLEQHPNFSIVYHYSKIISLLRSTGIETPSAQQWFDTAWARENVPVSFKDAFASLRQTAISSTAGKVDPATAMRYRGLVRDYTSALRPFVLRYNTYANALQAKAAAS